MPPVSDSEELKVAEKKESLSVISFDGKGDEINPSSFQIPLFVYCRHSDEPSPSPSFS
jgi:hypothetical protein